VGNLTDALRSRGYAAVGFDLDQGALHLSQRRYSAASLVCGDVDQLPFCDEAFEYAVLRESIHHFSFDRALEELHRVVRRGLVIFDPNPTGIVRLARKIIAHDDEEAPSEEVIAHLCKHGFAVRSVRFRDVMAFPLSGGFVGPELVPNFSPLKKFILAVDDLLTSTAHRLRLERWLCWRYVVEAQKKPREG
jgi:SAM-dependent methyltransferase